MRTRTTTASALASAVMIFEEQPETETLGYQFHVHQPSSTRIPSQLNWATSSFVFPFQLPPSYLLALVFRPLSSDRYFLKVHFLGLPPFSPSDDFWSGRFRRASVFIFAFWFALCVVSGLLAGLEGSN